MTLFPNHRFIDDLPLMISFSGGRSSALMTAELLKANNHKQVIVCFANTGKEEAGTLKFVHECDQLWGGIVNWLEYCPLYGYRIVDYDKSSRNGEPFSALINKRKYLPNVVTRFCTQELKIRPIKKFMLYCGFHHWVNAVGIRYDEPNRIARIKNTSRKERWEVITPLNDWKVTKADVIEYWRQMPFDLQIKDHEGNCDLCFLKGKNKIAALIKDKPQRLTWWCDEESKIGKTFHKGYSYQELAAKIKSNPEAFTIDNNIDCFCNID